MTVFILNNIFNYLNSLIDLNNSYELDLRLLIVTYRLSNDLLILVYLGEIIKDMIVNHNKIWKYKNILNVEKYIISKN